MALFAWPLSRVPKWFRKGFNWHRLEVSGRVTFMFQKQASSFFFSISFLFPYPRLPTLVFFLYIISPFFMKHHSVFNGKPFLLWEPLRSPRQEREKTTESDSDDASHHMCWDRQRAVKIIDRDHYFATHLGERLLTEEHPANQLRLVVYPIIHRVLYILGGAAGFLPWTGLFEINPFLRQFCQGSFNYPVFSNRLFHLPVTHCLGAGVIQWALHGTVVFWMFFWANEPCLKGHQLKKIWL